MSAVKSTLKSLTQMFVVKTQDFLDEIDNVHMVWLQEIQEEANLMFSRDFNSEPELMPKTPSQKKNTRRKRVSVGRQEEVRRRFSKGRRSNLRGSSVKHLDFVAEEAIPDTSAAESSASTRPKRTTRKNKQSKAGTGEDVSQLSHISPASVDECNIKPQLVEDEAVDTNSEADAAEDKPDEPCEVSQSSPVKIPSPSDVSAEQAAQPKLTPGHTAGKIAIAGNSSSSRRSSLKIRHSLGGLRHSMKQESLRRNSRQSKLKRKAAARKANTSRNSNIDASSCESMEEPDEVEPEPADPVVVTDSSDESPKATMSKQPSLARITRSVAANSPKLAPPPLFSPDRSNLPKTIVTITQQTAEASERSFKNIKRKAPNTTAETPIKRLSPKKSQSAVRPNKSSFLHTVRRNEILMMTPNSFKQTSVIKSFIKHTTPLKIDHKMNMNIVAKERQKLEALKKKQEQEEERMRKMEEEKKKKLEEFKRKRDERLRKVHEAKELREEEKKKKTEQKMASIDEKNDKRQAAEMAKKRIANKRQEDLDQKRKQEEEKRKKIQQAEEEKRQRELQAKEEEFKAKKLAEVRQLERERQAAAERERVEREKALALQQELERAAREKERRELEEKRKLEAQQQKLAAEMAAIDKEAAAEQVANAKNSLLKTPAAKGSALNVTVVVEKSPQSYAITPKGGNKIVTLTTNPENYGMDQNSDDSTDDESAPRKPIPSWAKGHILQQIITTQYFNPPDLDSFFGTVAPLKLEDLFYKSKPRYFKRTSSAVWHSPPNMIKH
ncbi:inner centromere protein A isoform X2 [Vanacampus margaritifer]